MAATRAVYFGAECDACGVDWAEIDDSAEGVILASSEEQMRDWWVEQDGTITDGGRWLCFECAHKTPEAGA